MGTYPVRGFLDGILELFNFTGYILLSILIGKRAERRKTVYRIMRLIFGSLLYGFLIGLFFYVADDHIDRFDMRFYFTDIPVRLVFATLIMEVIRRNMT